MKLAQGISTIGFRKWYERRLLTGHAHLALVLLAVLGLMMALEAANRYATQTEKWLDYGVALACALGGGWALRRYLFLLVHTESIANQADCPACKTYGRLELVAADTRQDAVRVSCRQCRHEWNIEY
jgi:hypothetical protein